MAEFLTVAEVAQALRVNPETVRRWIRAGALPATRVGRDYRIAAAVLDGLTGAPS